MRVDRDKRASCLDCANDNQAQRKSVTTTDAEREIMSYISQKKPNKNTYMEN